MSVISEFLKVAKGKTVYVDVIDWDCPRQGKVEEYDNSHVIVSGETGFDCIRIKQIRGISLPKQAEIIAE